MASLEYDARGYRAREEIRRRLMADLLKTPRIDLEYSQRYIGIQRQAWWDDMSQYFLRQLHYNAINILEDGRVMVNGVEK